MFSSFKLHRGHTLIIGSLVLVTPWPCFNHFFHFVSKVELHTLDIPTWITAAYVIYSPFYFLPVSDYMNTVRRPRSLWRTYSQRHRAELLRHTVLLVANSKLCFGGGIPSAYNIHFFSLGLACFHNLCYTKGVFTDNHAVSVCSKSLLKGKNWHRQRARYLKVAARPRALLHWPVSTYHRFAFGWRSVIFIRWVCESTSDN